MEFHFISIQPNQWHITIPLDSNSLQKHPLNQKPINIVLLKLIFFFFEVIKFNRFIIYVIIQLAKKATSITTHTF